VNVSFELSTYCNEIAVGKRRLIATVNFLLTKCIFPFVAMLTMPTSVTPTLSGGRTETVGQIGEFKAILR
jgi:hypothetical protein